MRDATGVTVGSPRVVWRATPYRRACKCALFINFSLGRNKHGAERFRVRGALGDSYRVPTVKN